MGLIRGCHCARKVIAVVVRQYKVSIFSAAKLTPHEVTTPSRENESRAPDTVAPVSILELLERVELEGTYVWFSPFGDANQDTAEKTTMKARPTTRLQLGRH